jgi:hypothetical protein
MCRLLHVEWRCKHTQNIWEYCRDATALSRTPSAAEQANTPCEAFVSKHGLTPNGPTNDEYRNFCCKFDCCLTDQSQVYKQVLELEAALGIAPKESIPHIPSFLLSRQQKSLKDARKKFQSLAKRHDERCEALYYGLGFVEGSDTYRAPAEKLVLERRRSESTEDSEMGDDFQTMEDTRSPLRQGSDAQVRRSGEHSSEEGEALREGDEAQDAGVFAGSKT